MSAMRVMTFNIRLETNEPDPGDNWSARRSAVAHFLQTSDVDVIGLQEVKPSQYEFLAEALAPHGYAHAGVGRDADGGGEASPIFFKRDRFDLIRERTRWLSETPSEPGSKLRGAGCPRVMTCTALRRSSGEDVFVFCAHLDHYGMAQAQATGKLPIQQAQAEIMLRQVDDFCSDSVGTRIVLGDFNSWRSAGAQPVLARAGYVDSSIVDGQENNDPTFVGFGSGSALRRACEWVFGGQIDWIFASPGTPMSNYTVHRGQYAAENTMRRLSDHVPVSTTVDALVSTAVATKVAEAANLPNGENQAECPQAKVRRSA